MNIPAARVHEAPSLPLNVAEMQLQSSKLPLLFSPFLNNPLF